MFSYPRHQSCKPVPYKNPASFTPSYFLPNVSGSCRVWVLSSSPGRRQKHTHVFQPRLRTCRLPFREQGCLRHFILQFVVWEGKCHPRSEWEMIHFWRDGNVKTDGSGPKLNSWTIHPENHQIQHLVLPNLVQIFKLANAYCWDLLYLQALSHAASSAWPFSLTLTGSLFHILQLKFHLPESLPWTQVWLRWPCSVLLEHILYNFIKILIILFYNYCSICLCSSPIKPGYSWELGKYISYFLFFSLST